MKFTYKLGVIGYGNMSTAILDGIIKNNIMAKSDIIVFDIMEEKRDLIRENGFVVAKSNEEVASSAEYILLAIKPQVSKDILASLRNYISENVFISIMAGVKMDAIKEILGEEVKVYRCMPNLCCKIGYGMCAVDVSALNENEAQFVVRLLGSTGACITLEEDKMDAVTSISGSGAAYVFYFIKSMLEGGMDNGLTYEESFKLTLKTFEGATKMIEQTENVNIDELIQNVCSKGGTTIQAIDCFNENKLGDIIKDGVARCYNRSKELSK